MVTGKERGGVGGGRDKNICWLLTLHFSQRINDKKRAEKLNKTPLTKLSTSRTMVSVESKRLTVREELQKSLGIPFFSAHAAYLFGLRQVASRVIQPNAEVILLWFKNKSITLGELMKTMTFVHSDECVLRVFTDFTSHIWFVLIMCSALQSFL